MKNNISFILFFVLFFVCISIGCISADTENDSNSNSLVIEENETHVEGMYVTDPDYFRNFENDPNTVAIFGEVPKVEGSAADNYFSCIDSVARSIQKNENFTNYLEEHGGSLAGYSSNRKGWLLIRVDPSKKENLTSQDIENIMSIINETAENQEIENIAVVFHASRLEINTLEYELTG